MNHVYKDDKILIIRCEDMLYPDYRDRFFVIHKSEGYGYFYDIIKTYTKGEILDQFNITITV